MWYTKIEGTYWRNKKRYTFCIDEKSEKAEYMYDGLLKILECGDDVVFEIVRHEEYWKGE